VAYKNVSMKYQRYRGWLRGGSESNSMMPWSQIFLRSIRADLDLIVNEFKQIGFIGLIGLLIMNATIVTC